MSRGSPEAKPQAKSRPVRSQFDRDEIVYWQFSPIDRFLLLVFYLVVSCLAGYALFYLSQHMETWAEVCLSLVLLFVFVMSTSEVLDFFEYYVRRYFALEKERRRFLGRRGHH